MYSLSMLSSSRTRFLLLGKFGTYTVVILLVSILISHCIYLPFGSVFLKFKLYIKRFMNTTATLFWVVVPLFEKLPPPPLFSPFRPDIIYAMFFLQANYINILFSTPLRNCVSVVFISHTIGI
jgi:hypothetical protein